MALVLQFQTFGVACDTAFNMKQAMRLISDRIEKSNSTYPLIIIDYRLKNRCSDNNPVQVILDMVKAVNYPHICLTVDTESQFANHINDPNINSCMIKPIFKIGAFQLLKKSGLLK